MAAAAANHTQKYCHQCLKTEQELKSENTNRKIQRCAQCKIANYCGPACQRKAWPSHKPICKTVLMKGDHMNYVATGSKDGIPWGGIYQIKSAAGARFSKEYTAKEKTYITQLSAYKLDDILGEKGAEVKALGQKIFNEYKEAAGGDTYAGRDGAVRICEALKKNPNKGNLRARYVEYAWDGIGDATWFWQR